MAVEASFIPWGTRVSISSVVRTVTGMAMIASATAPASAEKCPMRTTSSSYTNRPMMIDGADSRSEEHTSELQSRGHLVCRLLLEKKNKKSTNTNDNTTSQHEHN